MLCDKESLMALIHGIKYIIYISNEPIMYSRENIFKLNKTPNQCFFNSSSAEVN